ncbi:MAG: phosphoglycerate dehydrogenase [Candidatus Omnitrophica bacterium]|nr:phosphoglycerate dehydrogenase [Candidatus Omnitrophota bacterium]
MKILVSDPLGKAGLAVLKKEKAFTIDENYGLKPEELKKVIADYDAIIIRSGTKLTKDLIDAAKKLRVIGRAGVGVDNVDLEAATKRGIIVMNTPEGNTISTAEQTFSLLMSLARNIPQAVSSVKAGQWKRQDFLGTELNGKVLGVIGFGRIGREVTKRASAFGMRVVVFDPFISKASVKEYPVEFKDLKSLLKIADFITVHTPLTPETKYILNSETFKLCKKGVKVINCARGGIIEEKALIEALQSKKVSGAALDVFEKEPPPADHPFLKMPQVICTPHLGAATEEAQENVAVDVAHQVVDALANRAFKNAVNLPNVDPETFKAIRPWLILAEQIGKLPMQLFDGSLKKVNIRYGGEVTRYPLTPLTNAVIKGILTPICGETVNYVNAPGLAKERGITVVEEKSTETGDFTNFIEVETHQTGEPNRVMGTIFGSQLPRIVRINEFLGMDVDPQGVVIFIKNEDQPGVVGKLGTILGTNKINIAEMSLARVTQGKKVFAMTTINTDNEVPAKVLTEIKKFSPIIDVKVVNLGRYE